MRPSSFARPASIAPCALNVQAQGPVCTSRVPPTMPGTSASERRVAAGVGSAAMMSLLDHRLPLGALHVDDRRLAGDGDRFLERADRISALTVAMNDPVSSMPFALDRAEAGQRERHGVGAGPQVLDPVLAGRRR